MIITELEIDCFTEAIPGQLTFVCGYNYPLASVVCSFDGEPEEICSLPLVMEIGRFGTEKHTVVVTAIDVYGRTKILTLHFQLVESK